MKKRLIVLLCLFGLLVSGCTKSNSPSKKVEEFLGKYQSMDSEVLTQLDNIISNDTNMNETQRKDYQALMEKQYQNLAYKIKKEDIDGDKATVLVEIEVFDYANSILESKNYYNEHRDEFENGDKKDENAADGALNDNNDDNNADNNDDNNGEDNSLNNDKEDESGEVVGGAIDDIGAFIDYKIKQLKDVTDKAKYEITFYLTKKDGDWVVEDISDEDRQKIHGLYEH